MFACQASECPTFAFMSVTFGFELWLSHFHFSTYYVWYTHFYIFLHRHAFAPISDISELTTNMTKSRHRHERRAALTVELAVLLLATAWIALLLRGASEHIPTSLRHHANVLLVALVLLLAFAYVASLLTPSRLPGQLQKAFRYVQAYMCHLQSVAVRCALHAFCCVL